MLKSEGNELQALQLIEFMAKLLMLNKARAEWGTVHPSQFYLEWWHWWVICNLCMTLSGVFGNTGLARKLLHW